MAQDLQRKLTTIHFGGKLGQLFGKTWELMVSSPADALKAIDINLKGKLRNYLVTDGYHKYYKISLQDKKHLIGENELRNKSGNCDIYIWPTIKGKNSGTAKIIAGVALIALTIWNPFGWAVLATGGAGGLLSGGTVGWAGSIALGIGTSLVLGGISQLLAPHPNNGQGLESNNFQGTIAAGVQGGCVPVVYGKALVSPTPISIWFGAVDYNTTQNAYVGAVEFAGLPGGGYEVVPQAQTANSNGTDQ